jgi:predicted membrane metal-binding protein
MIRDLKRRRLQTEIVIGLVTVAERKTARTRASDWPSRERAGRTQQRRSGIVRKAGSPGQARQGRKTLKGRKPHERRSSRPSMVEKIFDRRGQRIRAGGTVRSFTPE